MRKCLPSVITSLEREAQEQNDAQASGLATFVKKYILVGTLYMLSDVPPLAKLSHAFQRRNVDFSMVKPLIQGTKATVGALLLTLGEYFHSLPTVFPELRQCGISQPSEKQQDTFKQDVYKYLVILSQHISGRFRDGSLMEGFGLFDPIACST